MEWSSFRFCFWGGGRWATDLELSAKVVFIVSIAIVDCFECLDASFLLHVFCGVIVCNLFIM